MTAWLPAGVPAVFLALAVLYSKFSGNDKAPLLVLLVLAANALLVLALLVAAGMGLGPTPWRRAGMAALPLLYAAIVVVLARLGWVDSGPLLGFR